MLTHVTTWMDLEDIGLNEAEKQQTELRVHLTEASRDRGMLVAAKAGL